MADNRTCQLTSYRENPTPARINCRAEVPLDMSRPFTLEDMREAAAAMIAAGVPRTATIQVNYGSRVFAFWGREDGWEVRDGG